MAASYADHDMVAQEMKKSGLDFVMARPTRLTGGNAMPVKFYGDRGDGIGGFATVTRRSVAVFLVDAVERKEWDRATPVIAN